MYPRMQLKQIDNVRAYKNNFIRPRGDVSASSLPEKKGRVPVEIRIFFAQHVIHDLLINGLPV